MAGYDKPTVSRKAILDTLGEDSTRWRNSSRIEDVSGSWPNPQSERARAYEKIMGHERTPSAVKGRP